MDSYGLALERDPTRWRRAAQMEALHLAAASGSQQLYLLRRLDALGDHGRRKAGAQVDDAPNDRGGFRLDAEVAYEGAVDLDAIERQRA